MASYGSFKKITIAGELLTLNTEDILHQEENNHTLFNTSGNLIISDSASTTSSIDEITNQNNIVWETKQKNNDSLTISNLSCENATFVLYDILYNKILEQRLGSSKTIVTNQLPSGIYCYEIRNSEELISAGKVIKK